MRPSTVISLMVGVGAIALALAPAPEDDMRASAVTVAEAQLIEHIRELAQAPAEEALPAWHASLAGAEPLTTVASLDAHPLSEEPAISDSMRADAAANHVVLPEALNVRAGPSSQTAVVGRLLQNERVAVIEERNGWLRVSGADADGWAFSRYLAAAD